METTIMGYIGIILSSPGSGPATVGLRCGTMSALSPPGCDSRCAGFKDAGHVGYGLNGSSQPVPQLLLSLFLTRVVGREQRTHGYLHQFCIIVLNHLAFQFLDSLSFF